MKIPMTHAQASAKFAAYAPNMLKRYNQVAAARKELVNEGVEPSAVNIKERTGFRSMGTVYTYLPVVEALEGIQAESVQPDVKKTEEPFSDAVAKLTSEAKAQIDALGENLVATIKAAVEESQRRSRMNLETHIEASNVALREAQAETTLARGAASTMADEVEFLELRTLELNDELSTAQNKGNKLSAELHETQISLDARTQEAENAQRRNADLERLEAFLRLELEVERTERHDVQRELKSESSHRQSAEMKLVGLQEQVDARLRETLQARGDVSTLHRKIASLEERLYGTVL